MAPRTRADTARLVSGGGGVYNVTEGDTLVVNEGAACSPRYDADGDRCPPMVPGVTHGSLS